MPEPQRGVAYVKYIALYNMAQPGELMLAPPIAAGDFRVRVDAGSFANFLTLPVVEPAGSRWVKLSFAAAEMAGDVTTWEGIDQTVPKAWGDVGGSLDTPVQTAASLHTTLITLLSTTGVTLTVAERVAIADALLNRPVAAGTDTSSDSNRTVRQYLYNLLRSRWEISPAGVLTVYKPDDATPAFTTPLTAAPGASPVSAGNPAGP